jgi:type IV pilus assembly protein PilN
MKITVNLATRPYADQGPALKRLRIGMGVLVVLIGLLLLGLRHFHQSALKMQAQEDQMDLQVAQIQHEEQSYQVQMQQPANAKVLTQAKFLNHLFDEKSFSWTAAMEDLERVLPPGEQVTSIEPVRAKNGQLTLRLKVSGLRERSVEMVRNMEHSRRFIHPRVAGENAENSSSKGDLEPVKEVGRVNFDILAEYNPATLDERAAAIATQKRHPGSGRSAVSQAITGQSRARALPQIPTSLPQQNQSPLPDAGQRPQYVMPNRSPRGMGVPGQIPSNGPQPKNHESNALPPADQPPDDQTDPPPQGESR